MFPIFFLLLKPVLAQETPNNDISIDLGVSSGCLLGCFTYDKQLMNKLDLGVMGTAALLFYGGGLYAQYTLLSTDKHLVYIEPSAGIIWSPVSREIFYNGVVSVGYERNLKNNLYCHGHLGGGVISYDLEDINFWPDARLGFGKRF